MKKIFLGGGIVSIFTVFLIVSTFSNTSDNMVTDVRSIDLMGASVQKDADLHDTEIGNQYKKSSNQITSSFNSGSNNQWKNTHIALQGIIVEDIQKNVTYDYYSEMPTPSQKVLDKFEEKFENPKPRPLPAKQSSENEIDPSSNDSINIGDSLNEIKKNYKFSS